MVRKDVLWCGRWEYPGGRVLRVTPADIHAAARNANLMLGRDRHQVPLCWEHQDAARPRPVEMAATVFGSANERADWARNCIAPAARFVVEPDPDRRGKPRLAVEFDAGRLTGDELRRIERAGKVSCRLEFDPPRWGKAGRYAGLCVSHVAVTPKPVEGLQGPFLMSAAGRAARRRTFDLAAARGFFDMADDAGKGGDKKGDGGGAGNGSFGRLVQALQDAYGFTPPDGVADVDGLCLAVETIAANKPGGGGDEFGLDDEPDPDKATVGGETPPLMMSQAEYAKKWPARVTNDRAEVASEIRAMYKAGQLPKPAAESLLAEFKAFEMSYVAADGTVADTGLVAAVRWLKKAVPKGTFITAKKVDMSTTEVDPPDKFTRSDGLAKVIEKQKAIAARYSKGKS